MRKDKDKKNGEQNGEKSLTETEESGFDGWSDDVPTKPSGKNDDDWCTDTSAEAVKQRMKQLGEGVKGLTHNDDLDKSVEERFQIFFKFVKVRACYR